MQYLYRAYDGDDTLLYVGVSGKWSERLHSHEKNSEWMEQTDYVSIERFSDRDSVLAAERTAITKERPLFNKDFNVAYEKPMDHLQKLKFFIYRDVPVDELHAELVSDAKRVLRETFPQSFVGRQSRYIAWAIISFLMHSQSVLDCRNCHAIQNHKQFVKWADDVDDEHFAGGNFD